MGWLAFKSKLESRLILSAGPSSCFVGVLLTYAIGVEVGQALLQKYEAYVRRHEVCRLRFAFVVVFLILPVPARSQNFAEAFPETQK